MSTQGSGHHPGEMDTTEQEKTFAGFVRTGVWLAVVVAVALIFLAIVGI